MTTKILELKSVPRPSDWIVTQLQDLLRLAEAGEIIAFAHASVTDRMTIRTGWGHDDDDAALGHGFMLIAAASHLLHNMQSACD